MRWVYGRIREAYRWPNAVVDELLISEAQEYFEHWREEPPAGVVLRVHFPVKSEARWNAAPEPDRDVTPQEVTEEEFAALVETSQRMAERHGGGR